MANWPQNPMWHPADTVNAGNQYTVQDGITFQDLNYIIENILYLKALVDAEINKPEQLNPPTVSISSTGVATWPAVPNASSYKYSISGQTAISNTSRSVQMTDGQTIQVMAVGDGTKYLSSAYSAVKTYHAPAQALSIYYGVSTKTELTSTEVQALSSKQQTTRVCTFAVSPNKEYVYFAAPKKYCTDSNGNNTVKFIVGGLDQTGAYTEPSSLSINSTEYYVYRSTYKLGYNNMAVSVQ